MVTQIGLEVGQQQDLKIRPALASATGYLQSSSFGSPVTTVGGVFGSGGPRAFQLALRFSF